MFTKNWYKLLSFVLGVTSSNITLTNSSGAEKTPPISYPFIENSAGRDWNCKLQNLKTSMNGYGGVAFGDGDTPPTLDDITLSGNMVTTLTVTPVYSITSDASGAENAVEYTIINTGADAVTIKEVGLFYGSNNASSPPILIERSVLDTPVTIPSGEVGRVTLKLKNNYPT